MINFSLILPVYNVNQYLIELFPLLQGIGEEFEIIFIDDGSTDGSSELLNDFTKNSNNIRLIRKENGGVSSARNLGIECARGQYIACIDPDDIISPKFFKYLTFAINKFPDADTIYYKYHKFSHAEEINNILDLDFSQERIKLSSTKKLLALHNYPWLRVVKKEFFINNLFPEGIIYEDSVTVPVLNARSQCVVFIDDVLYFYRVRVDSLTNNSLIRNKDMISSLCLLDERLEKLNLPRACYYASAAHISKSALIIWTKLSLSKGSYESFYQTIYSYYKNISIQNVVKSDASLVDKVAFLFVKLGRFGFAMFSFFYKKCKRVI